MKYKYSILICVMDDGSQNLYVNGVLVMQGAEMARKRGLEGIANCDATKGSVTAALNKQVDNLRGATIKSGLKRLCDFLKKLLTRG